MNEGIIKELNSANNKIADLTRSVNELKFEVNKPNYLSDLEIDVISMAIDKAESLDELLTINDLVQIRGTKDNNKGRKFVTRLWDKFHAFSTKK